VISHNKTLAAQLIRSSSNSSQKTRSNISSATSITTNRKHTSRGPTPTSRRTHRLTKRSSGCACRHECTAHTARHDRGRERFLHLRRHVAGRLRANAADGKTRQHTSREAVLSRLVDMLYERNDISFSRGKFRVRGDVVEVYPATADEEAVRLEFFWRRNRCHHPLRSVDRSRPRIAQCDHIFSTKQFVTPADKLNRALQTIRAELEDRIKVLESQNKLLEAQRLRIRTEYDLEMFAGDGFCNGSKIIRDISPAGLRVRSRTRSSTFSRKISWS